MLYAGLDLSRKRLDVHVLRDDGSTALVTAVSPDTDALRTWPAASVMTSSAAATGRGAH